MENTAGCFKVVGMMQLENLSGNWTGENLGWKLPGTLAVIVAEEHER